jgi:hypothetical protein
VSCADAAGANRITFQAKVEDLAGTSGSVRVSGSYSLSDVFNDTAMSSHASFTNTSSTLDVHFGIVESPYTTLIIIPYDDPGLESVNNLQINFPSTRLTVSGTFSQDFAYTYRWRELTPEEDGLCNNFDPSYCSLGTRTVAVKATCTVTVR